MALAGTAEVQAHLAAYILNLVTGNLGKTMIFLDEAVPLEATWSRVD